MYLLSSMLIDSLSCGFTSRRQK